MHLDIVLAPRDPAALTRYATQVSTPGSPLYHDYLPRGTFPSVFGPTRAAIATVRSALTGLGLHPGKISANHLAIPVTATASRVESAFGVKLNRYRLAGGQVGYANLTAPRLVANDIQKNPDFGFNDTNDYTGKSGEYPVLVGYDLATGIGSPVGGALATQLCKTSTQSGGCRLAAADGRVYSFHTAGYGSVKNPKSKVVGIADDPKSNGYWVVTAKGAVSAFHAPFHGSAKNPSSPIVGIAADNNGTGYWLVTAKGHVYALGAPSHGSVTGSLASPVVGIAADPFTRVVCWRQSAPPATSF